MLGGRRHCTGQQDVMGRRIRGISKGVLGGCRQDAQTLRHATGAAVPGGNTAQGERTATAAGSTVVDGWRRCCGRQKALLRAAGAGLRAVKQETLRRGGKSRCSARATAPGGWSEPLRHEGEAVALGGKRHCCGWQEPPRSKRQEPPPRQAELGCRRR